ncbi:MAG: hypothetical protein KKC76_08830 [Proteobacteria bacterium]|nr:hypothetical protein [Pseudomonadota bacterium]MBU4294910.1 hypothetical protein [Pseudomonadota bacterium]MCG2747334.1 hypothetical protein [Desulfobulbaceae bacterium]
MIRNLTEFIKISPGFKAAVNLRNDRDNLGKVAGYIPTEVAREIILDFAKKLHPTTPDSRSRIVMGTYGTGKSHLALVLLNFFMRPAATQELQLVMEKLDPDTRAVLKQYRQEVPAPYLIVSLYGNEGNIADSLMMGLRRALTAGNLDSLLPPTAFDAAIKRIDDLEENYKDSFVILKQKVEERGHTVGELKTRLAEYQKKFFDLFREIYPSATSGAQFDFLTMLDPVSLYESIVKELRDRHGYSGIAVFWDEFGNKMEEVVKDPTGKEGLDLQAFAESCNASAMNQIHLYLFCHRSLKEYHDISRIALASSHQKLEEDLRKIEGRFKQYILKSTDIETFQLIDGVIIADEQSPGWADLITTFGHYLDSLVQETARLNYFVGFTREELKSTVVHGTYPLHPMAVYSLPAISEKVAQNNRTLFTCLCEDEPGSFKRFLDKASLDLTTTCPPMFTVDQLWEYFAHDIRQQERTASIFRDFEHLKTRLKINDEIGLRILKTVSVFRVTTPTRFKATEDILIYSLNISHEQRDFFRAELARLSDLQSENHILMRLQSDGSYRPAVNGATIPILDKIRKLIEETPEKLGQKSTPYLKSLWVNLPGTEPREATDYGDEFGVSRSLIVEPVSMYQLRESLDNLTKNIGKERHDDGIILAVLCESSSEIEEAKTIARTTLADKQYQQIVLAIPKEPLQLTRLLLEHQALTYLKKNEASLYGEGGELYEEWRIWSDDKHAQLLQLISELLTPEKQNLDYFWQGKFCNIQHNRELKKLATVVMREVFPYCPQIGDPKLAQDDFAGNWGYRNNCRDVVLKLTANNAAETLWKETAAAPQHVINLLLKTNGILRKNQTGDIEISQPDENTHLGANKVWFVISDFLKNARQRPVEMKNLVTRLRRPPYGLKCRVMPIFFATAAHHELAMGNISFEFQRTPKQVEKITTIESDTLEKVFTAPERYKLAYVDVSSNQIAVIAGLAKVYNVTLLPADPALERVKKVGMALGAWWRAQPKHAQITSFVSDEADVIRDYIFKPLAELEPDTEQILLKDTFEHVFDAEKKVKQADVEKLIDGIKTEFEGLLVKLQKRILDECHMVFEDQNQENSTLSLHKWFLNLPDEKKNFVHHGDPGVLANFCRENPLIDANTPVKLDENPLLKLAEKLTGLQIPSWFDDMIIKFNAKLGAAKEYIETFVPSFPVPSPTDPPPDIRPNQVCVTHSIKGENKRRIIEVLEELSPNGQALENMLNTTVDQIGRSLDEKEKTVILYRFLRKHFFSTVS